MSCASCGAALPAGSKFCGECGTKLDVGGDLRDREDVTTEWVADAFREIGYSITDVNDPNQFWARHDRRPEYFVQFRDDYPAIVATARWFFPPKTKLSAVPDRIARANSSSYYINFTLKDGGALWMASTLHICTRIAYFDVARFLDCILFTMDQCLNESGLMDLFQK